MDCAGSVERVDKPEISADTKTVIAMWIVRLVVLLLLIELQTLIHGHINPLSNNGRESSRQTFADDHGWWRFAQMSHGKSDSESKELNSFDWKAMEVEINSVKFLNLLQGDSMTDNSLLDDWASYLGGSNCTMASPLPVSEIAALWEFYNATQGPQWCASDYYEVFWSFPATSEEICSFTGVGCDCVDGALHVVSISLQSSCLNGTIPVSFSNLTALSQLELDVNRLYGLFPNVSSMPIMTLSAAQNNFTGPVCPQISGLSRLLVLDLHSNSFSGPLDSCFAFPDMFSIDLSANNFTSTIPETIGLLSSVFDITLSHNLLRGTIPVNLTRLFSLQSIDLSHNLLHGSIPVFSGLPSLFTLDVSNNRLSGTIPIDCFSPAVAAIILSANLFNGSITNVSWPASVNTLDLSGNYLTGCLPPGLLQRGYYITLDVSDNFLSGRLPNVSTAAPAFVEQLNFSLNAFHGNIPPSWQSLGAISIDLSFNQLSGPLPDSLFATWAVLSNLALNNNGFTGAIPSSVASLSSLLLLLLQNNQFSSSLPAAVLSLPSLVTVYLYNNALEGNLLDLTPPPANSPLANLWLSSNSFSSSLPPFLSQLGSLLELVIDDNAFTGDPFVAFNASVQLTLQVVNLDNNQFTGTLPAALFALPNLIYFSAINNCLSGSLEGVCSHPSQPLTVLSLDGADENPSCPPFHSLGLFKQSAFTGTIPHCLMQLRSLETLHLSGIGLSGSIPPIAMDSNLTDLSLSNNRLTGAIPLSIQQHRLFTRLDLSNNQLNGVLSEGFQVNPGEYYLTLAINRLSGPLPSAISTLQTATVRQEGLSLNYLNVLTSNVFSCDLNEIPSEDVSAKSYFCGSDELDISMTVWGGCVALAAVTLLALASYGKRNKAVSSGTLDSYSYSDIYRGWERFSMIFAQSRHWYGSIDVPFNSQLYLGCPASDGDAQTCEVMSRLSVSAHEGDNSRPSVAVVEARGGEGMQGTCQTKEDDVVWERQSSYCQTEARQLSKQRRMPATAIPSPPQYPSSLYFLWSFLYDTKALIVFLNLCSSFGKLLSLLLAIAVIPIYLSLNIATDASIVTYTYGYVVSMTYLHGPAIVVLCALLVASLLLASMSLLHKIQFRYRFVMQHSCGYTVDTYYRQRYDKGTIGSFIKWLQQYFIVSWVPSSSGLKYSALILLLHAINIAVTLTVNVLYVNSTISASLSRTELFVLQLVIGSFKNIWNSCYIPFSSGLLTSLVRSNPLFLAGNGLSTQAVRDIAQSSMSHSSTSSQRHLSNLMQASVLDPTTKVKVKPTDIQLTFSALMQQRYLMAITNYILAPCIATLFTNQSCFYYILRDHSSIASSTELSVCKSFVISLGVPVCSSYGQVTFSSSFTPPFEYSYACGSALLMTYTPVFVYAYLVSGIVIPCLQYLMLLFPATVLWLQLADSALKSTFTRACCNWDTSAAPVQSDSFPTATPGESTWQRLQTDDRLLATLEVKNGFNLVKGRSIVSDQLVHLTVLLTFGLACPWLGFIVAFGIWSEAAMWKLMIGRYMCIVHRHLFGLGQPRKDGPNSAITATGVADAEIELVCESLKQLEQNNRHSWKGIFCCFMLIATVTALFWSFVFFDMIADDFGIVQGFVFSLCFALILPFALLAYRFALSTSTYFLHNDLPTPATSPEPVLAPALWLLEIYRQIYEIHPVTASASKESCPEPMTSNPLLATAVSKRAIDFHPFHPEFSRNDSIEL